MRVTIICLLQYVLQRKLIYSIFKQCLGFINVKGTNCVGVYGKIRLISSIEKMFKKLFTYLSRKYFV